MKKQLLCLIGFVLLAGQLLAQSPEAFKYQAIVRNTSGMVLVNQAVSFKLSILQGSMSGTVVYSELQTAVTNEFGMVNLAVGSGTVVLGSFPDIPWGSGPFFLKVEFDPAGGSSYVLMGTRQLLSVPYSLFSKNAGDSYWKLDVNNIFNRYPGRVKIGTSNFDPDPEESKLFLENLDGGTRSTLSFRNNAWGRYATGRIEIRDGSWLGMQYLAKQHLFWRDNSTVARFDSLGNVVFSPTPDFSVYPSARLTIDGISSAENAYTMPWGLMNPLGQVINAYPTNNPNEVSGLLSKADGGYYENNSVVAEAGTSAIGNNIGLLARVTGLPSSGYAYGLFAFDVINNGLTTWAAKFAGRVNISDGTQANGRVLTSDYQGNASWQDLITPKVSFKAYGLPTTSIPYYTDVPITSWQNVEYEEGGSNFNPATGEYTIPVTGLYEITGSTVWNAPASGGYALGGININGYPFDYTASDISPSSNFWTGSDFNTKVQLNAGDVLQYFVLQSTSASLSIFSDGGARTNKFSVTLLH
jgi:hypothetical protein